MSVMHDAHTSGVPHFLYGTAWKEERTEQLTRAALEAGFRAIDTANQRKHYYEEGVGAALRASALARSELFLQTKFTYARGQDHRLPYDPRADIATQVQQSFDSSLEHLGVSYVDSYVLHGPWGAHGWCGQDREAWAAMEALHRAGRTRALGVSNVSLEQLAALCAAEQVAPRFVQNRCYASTGWDRDVRAFCRARGIVYQGFSLLTANRAELASDVVRAVAKRASATVPQVIFRFAMELGMVPLTGTTDRAHMAEDLACGSVALTTQEITALESL